MVRAKEIKEGAVDQVLTQFDITQPGQHADEVRPLIVAGYDAGQAAALEIARELDRREWSADTVQAIAETLRAYGFTIRELVEP